MKQSRFSFGRFLWLGLAAIGLPYISMLIWPVHVEGSWMPETEYKKTILLDRGSERMAVDLEEYVIGVAAAWVLPESEPEAVKAQVILARTALYRQMNGAESIPEAALDLDYLGKEELSQHVYQQLQNAAAETTGQTITWNGEYIAPWFHYLSTGQTREGEEGYLGSVRAEEAMESEEITSQYFFTREELARRLNAMTPSPRLTANRVWESIQIVKRETAGYVDTIMVGEQFYSGETVQWALSLPSPAFHFEEAENGICATVTGIGHGYGLEQYGANEKAKAGWTAEEILQYYYKNIVISTE